MNKHNLQLEKEVRESFDFQQEWLRERYGNVVTTTPDDGYISTFSDSLDHLLAALEDPLASDVGAAGDDVGFAAEKVVLSVPIKDIPEFLSKLICLLREATTLAHLCESDVTP